ERRLAESLLPAEPAVAARWSVAVMELGALVCTAASPRCGSCPVAGDCAWLAAGGPAEPAGPPPPRRTPQDDGTDPPGRGPPGSGRRLAESLLPAEPAVAARWSVAVMELGALVCTAASPRCGSCPVAGDCAWLAAGCPAEPAGRPAPRRTQKYDGTDRQCRGRL